MNTHVKYFRLSQCKNGILAAVHAVVYFQLENGRHFVFERRNVYIRTSKSKCAKQCKLETYFKENIIIINTTVLNKTVVIIRIENYFSAFH